MTPTTDIATTPRSELAITTTQTGWTEAQLDVLRAVGVPQNTTKAQLDLFFHVAARSGLDPFARQIYMVNYGDGPTIQTGINGYRTLARRAASTAGDTMAVQGVEWCGEDGVWRDVWLSSEPPAAARCTVLRGGQPFPAVVLYSEYVGRKKDGAVNRMWATKPAHMLGKCAEAAALRMAFPQDLSAIVVDAEAEHLDNPRTVAGEVVAEQIHPNQVRPLAEALEAVESATSLDELRGVWRHFKPLMGSLADKAQLDKAAKQRAAQIEAEPATQEPVPAAVVVAMDSGDVVEWVDADGVVHSEELPE